MKETDWFSIMVAPVRFGVYRTRHIGYERNVYTGFSYFGKNGWRPMCSTPYWAAKERFRSMAQSREWCGLAEKPE